MAKSKALKGRIRSVQNTRKITRTMELVATSKLKRAQDRVVAARPYAEALAGVIADLVTPELAERFPLLRRPAPPAQGGPAGHLGPEVAIGERPRSAVESRLDGQHERGDLRLGARILPLGLHLRGRPSVTRDLPQARAPVVPTRHGAVAAPHAPL